MVTESSSQVESQAIERSIVDLATESWRFQKLFARALAKLDAGESLRFSNQHRYFIKRIEECLADAGFRLVNIEGQAYDPGALNDSVATNATELRKLRSRQEGLPGLFNFPAVSSGYIRNSSPTR